MNSIQPAPPNPGDAEPIARYILNTNRFSVGTNRVKHTAFMPPTNSDQLSVFVISHLAESIIWKLGERHVAIPQSKTLYARADVSVGAVKGTGLRLDVNNVPLRHANVIGWPLEKSARKLKAEMLAESSVLRLRS